MEDNTKPKYEAPNLSYGDSFGDSFGDEFDEEFQKTHNSDIDLKNGVIKPNVKGGGGNPGPCVTGLTCDGNGYGVGGWITRGSCRGECYYSDSDYMEVAVLPYDDYFAAGRQIGGSRRITNVPNTFSTNAFFSGLLNNKKYWPGAYVNSGGNTQWVTGAPGFTDVVAPVSVTITSKTLRLTDTVVNYSWNDTANQRDRTVYGHVYYRKNTGSTKYWTAMGGIATTGASGFTFPNNYRVYEFGIFTDYENDGTSWGGGGWIDDNSRAAAGGDFVTGPSAPSLTTGKDFATLTARADSGYYPKTHHIRCSYDGGSTWTGWVQVSTDTPISVYDFPDFNAAKKVIVQAKAMTQAGDSLYETSDPLGPFIRSSEYVGFIWDGTTYRQVGAGETPYDHNNALAQASRWYRNGSSGYVYENSDIYVWNEAKNEYAKLYTLEKGLLTPPEDKTYLYTDGALFVNEPWQYHNENLRLHGAVVEEITSDLSTWSAPRFGVSDANKQMVTSINFLQDTVIKSASRMCANFNNNAAVETNNIAEVNGLRYAKLAFSNYGSGGFDPMADPPSCDNMFCGCKDLASVDLTGFDTSDVEDFSYMFLDCHSLSSLDLSPLNTSNATTTRYMFGKMYSLSSLDISPLDTSKVTNMGYMFANCTALTSLDVSSLQTSKVYTMSSMFFNTGLTSIDISMWDLSSLQYANQFFQNCGSLSSVDMTGLDLGKLQYAANFFAGCGSLQQVDLSVWATAALISDVSGFFNGSGITSINLTPLGSVTGNVQEWQFFLANCQGLTSVNVSPLDTSSATNMNNFFDGSVNITTIYDNGTFNTASVTASGNMFRGLYDLVGGNGTIYDGNIVDKTRAHIDGIGGAGYFTQA